MTTGTRLYKITYTTKSGRRYTKTGQHKGDTLSLAARVERDLMHEDCGFGAVDSPSHDNSEAFLRASEVESFLIAEVDDE